MKKVYDNYDFLRRLTEKRFADAALADEAYSYAFEGLVQDDWRRVRAYKGKSSFRGYLGRVWCRLLEDFRIKKFGKITPPQWIKKLGGIWEELFKLLCRRRFTIEESIEEIINQGTYDWDAQTCEKAAEVILAKIPNCGQKKGPVFSIDDDRDEDSANPCFPDNQATPDEMIMNKERWIALQALTNVFFMSSVHDPGQGADEKKLVTLVAAIREHLRLNEEEQLILTVHFVDGESITTVGKRLGLNPNQIHGKFKRLMARIRKTLPDLLEPYV